MALSWPLVLGAGLAVAAAVFYLTGDGVRATVGGSGATGPAEPLTLPDGKKVHTPMTSALGGCA
jgi:hypothetical protein